MSSNWWRRSRRHGYNNLHDTITRLEKFFHNNSGTSDIYNNLPIYRYWQQRQEDEEEEVEDGGSWCVLIKVRYGIYFQVRNVTWGTTMDVGSSPWEIPIQQEMRDSCASSDCKWMRIFVGVGWVDFRRKAAENSHPSSVASCVVLQDQLSRAAHTWDHPTLYSRDRRRWALLFVIRKHTEEEEEMLNENGDNLVYRVVMVVVTDLNLNLMWDWMLRIWLEVTYLKVKEEL